jgi:hypothetical protein
MEAIMAYRNKYLGPEWTMERLQAERLRVEAAGRKESTCDDPWLYTKAARRLLDAIGWGIAERIKESRKAIDIAGGR